MKKEEIFKRVSQEEIMERYLGIKVSKRKVRNPMRKDAHADCSFFYSSSGILYFNDFALGKMWSCISLVMDMYNTTFYNALKIINQDFGLGLDSNFPKPEKYSMILNIKEEKEKKSLDVVVSKWTKSKLLYWNSYGISSKTLRKYKVVPVEHVIVGDAVITVEELSFAYMEHFPSIKIYRPTANRLSKWKSNTTADLLHGSTGLEFKKDLLIITKSLKDVMVLNELGYEAISPMAENVMISESTMNFYKEKYKWIVIFYDNDGEFNPPKGVSGKGKQAAAKIANKYSLPMIFLDGEEKDISDYVFKYGKDNAKLKIEWLLGQVMTTKVHLK